MNPIRVLRPLAALCFLTLTLSLPAVAGTPGRTASVSGEIVSISAAARTLTVRAANGSQVILRVAPASRLSRNGATVGLAGLALRDSTTARFERNTLHVVSLRARGPAVTTTRGGFLGVDSALQSLSVGTPAGPRSFQLTPATLFVRNGRAATAGDFTSRDSLVIHSLPAANGAPVATDVEADGPDQEEVEGTLSAIAGSEVTITPGQGKPVTVHVNDSTVIRIHLPGGSDFAGGLADLEVGMEAEAKFDPASFVALDIEAEKEGSEDKEAHVEGTVGAVDATAGTITIDPKSGSPVTLAVDSSTRIKLDGESAALTDIPVGAKVEAEYDPATNIAAKIEAEAEDDGNDDDDDDGEELAEVEGNVTAVSAASITIAPKRSGSPVTLKIDASTVIRIDDKAGAAADIHSGDKAEAKYDRATLVAARIEVEREDEEEDD